MRSIVRVGKCGLCKVRDVIGLPHPDRFAVCPSPRGGGRIYSAAILTAAPAPRVSRPGRAPVSSSKRRVTSPPISVAR
jgi:hypothetical protein